MNNNKFFTTILQRTLLIVALVQSVSIFSSEAEDAMPMEDESVVAWIGDESFIDLNDIENYKKQMISENPQLEEYIKMISVEEINRSIGELLLQQNLVDLYIEKSKTSAKADYKKDLELAIQMATTNVNNKYFTQEIAASVNPTEKELKKFYEDNKKTIPNFLKERGGIKAVGISFDTEAEAKAFLKKLGNNDLAQFATKEDRELKDFGLVTKSSMSVDENIRSAILAVTKFPQTITILDTDETAWVVQAVSKKDETYYAYEEVKDLVKDRALQYQIAEKISDKLNNLKKEYKITVNDKFFGGIEPLTINQEDVETLIEELEEEGL